MHVIFAGLFFFAILTLWVPGYWPVSVFQTAVFVLAGVVVWRTRLRPPAFAWPLVPLSFAVVWGVFQWLTGRTACVMDTQLALLKWATFLAVFFVGISLFRDEGVRVWFRSAMVWFAFLVAVLASFQTFTSKGKVFWIFQTAVTEYLMGPILYRNHYAAFIEGVLPIALYMALRRERDSLMYSAMAAVMYASVVASASRTGTVLASAEVVLVPLLLWAFHRTSGRLAASALLRVGLLLGLCTAVMGWQSVWKRFLDADPLSVRRELTVSSMAMARSHPWFGTGLGTWPTVYPQYAIIDVGVIANQGHDDWLQWTVEGGIPFGIMLATLFFWSLRPAFRSVWGIGVVAVFLHAIVDYQFSRPALGSWAIVVLAMLVFADREREDRKSGDSVDYEQTTEARNLPLG